MDLPHMHTQQGQPAVCATEQSAAPVAVLIWPDGSSTQGREEGTVAVVAHALIPCDPPGCFSQLGLGQDCRLMPTQVGKRVWRPGSWPVFLM